jgi:hypothetical protein
MKINSKAEFEKKYIESLLDEYCKKFTVPFNLYHIVFGNSDINQDQIELMDIYSYKRYLC